MTDVGADKREVEGERPEPVVHVGDQGALSPDPIGSTTDSSPPSTVGGQSAARSRSTPTTTDMIDE
jgi:hypothetical protein